MSPAQDAHPTASFYDATAIHDRIGSRRSRRIASWQPLGLLALSIDVLRLLPVSKKVGLGAPVEEEPGANPEVFAFDASTTGPAAPDFVAGLPAPGAADFLL